MPISLLAGMRHWLHATLSSCVLDIMQSYVLLPCFVHPLLCAAQLAFASLFLFADMQCWQHFLPHPSLQTCNIRALMELCDSQATLIRQQLLRLLTWSSCSFRLVLNFVISGQHSHCLALFSHPSHFDSS